jgi:Fe-S cluster assembly ATP-binding protein
VSYILSLKNLILSRDGEKILYGVNLEVGYREVHSIIGANGGGKSTLAYTLMGLPCKIVHFNSLRFYGKSTLAYTFMGLQGKGYTIRTGSSVQKVL